MPPGRRERNRIKRCIREAFRLEQDQLGAHRRPGAAALRAGLAADDRARCAAPCDAEADDALRLAARGGARLPVVPEAACCRRPAASIRAAPTMPTRRSAPRRLAGRLACAPGASAAAGPGIRAVTTRCPDVTDGYPTTHPAFHLQLFRAHAVGGVGASEQRPKPRPRRAGSGSRAVAGAQRKPAAPRRRCQPAAAQSVPARRRPGARAKPSASPPT